MNQFLETIQRTDSHVLFGAGWCQSCETLKAYADKIKHVRTDIDVDDEPEVAEVAKIAKLPTLQVYDRGEKIKEIVGAAAIREFINIKPNTIAEEQVELSETEQLFEHLDTIDF